MHALLATGAVHHHLVETGLRCKCNLLVETGTARDPHHFACLIGYGATAVYPYMAYQTLFDMMRKGRVKLDCATRLELGRSYRARHPQGPLQDHVEDGHLDDRELSQLAAVRDRRARRRGRATLCFTGTDSRIQGAGFEDLRAGPAASSPRAPGIRAQPIEQGGLLKYVHGGEYHMYNPDVIATLQARGHDRATTSATRSSRGW